MGPPFEPMNQVDLKWVKLKTIFLVAITSARRVSELGALSSRSDLCEFHRDKVVLRPDPTFRPKIASTFHMGLDISLPSFCPRPQHPQERRWHTLDVCSTLAELSQYVTQTGFLSTFPHPDWTRCLLPPLVRPYVPV